MISRLFEIVTERYPEFSGDMKRRLVNAASRLIDPGLIDREACCEAVNSAIDAYARETA